MRQADIFYKNQLAGILTESDEGYEFCYLPDYLSLVTAKAIQNSFLNVGLKERYVDLLRERIHRLSNRKIIYF